MRILIVNTGIIPVHLYGGTERVIWGLGKELAQLGHEVTFLVRSGSSCDFASVLFIDENKPIVDQIPERFDIVHFNFQPDQLERVTTPYIVTIHGNSNNPEETFDRNAVFVSKNHAYRFQSESYVLNGLDWSDYTQPDLDIKRNYFHFLGKAAWRVKNVKGAIDVVKAANGEKLKVLGGVRFNFEMGMRFTFSPKIGFEGMVGGEKKDRLLNGSKGLIFPIRWHEPFGLAIIESLYYGCPVFGTPYGSLPELVNDEVGFLSNKQSELTEAIQQVESYSIQHCHEYARDRFNSKRMTLDYVKKYEQVLNGETLSPTTPQLRKKQDEKYLDWS